MKLMVLSLAGVMAASAMTPVAADAQGWHRGWENGRGWHGDRGWRGDRGWHRGWDRGRRYYGGGYYGRPRYWRGGPRFRTVCRWRPGPYGSVRRCYRVRW